MAASRYLDCQRKVMAVGQTLCVHVCAGAYGQMKRIEGVIEAFEPFDGVRLRLRKAFCQNSRGAMVLRDKGSQISITLPGQFDGEDFVCDFHFVDFEHGYHAFAEIIDGEAA